MFPRILQVFTFFAIAVSLFAQQSSLFIPIDVQNAYENGTRSYNGEPGESYWVNHSDYEIDVELIPDSNLIVGSAKITYYNESPDTLKRLTLRLYQDVLKEGASRDFSIGKKGITDGVIIKSLIVNDSIIDINSRSVYKTTTNMIVRLDEPLDPDGELEIEIDWMFTLSKIPLRMGNYGGDFFIAYWYPQVAVYDDVFGWDSIEYLGIVEFYNDFSNYDFNITVPGDYVVWATGELQNSDDVFHDKILAKIRKAKSSYDVVNVIIPEDYKKNEVTIPNEKNVWSFEAENVPDVSFCVSNNYNWDAASVQVDEELNRRVLTSAVYPDSIEQFKDAALYARETIEYMSMEMPGYPYPWPHTTSFCNKRSGGGMETPMMANDGAPLNKGRLVGLIFHEISHSYLPFYMGVNERRFAWMDEGWAAFFPKEIVDKYDDEYDYQARRVAAYAGAAGRYLDIPMMIPSFMMRHGTARNSFYNRPAIAYEELHQMLGGDLFKKAMQKYMSLWNEKHPIPYDFFFTFNEIVGEDLSWFWKPWFFEFGYPDLGIKSVSVDDNNIKVIVEKVGNIPTRVKLTFVFEDNTKEEIYKSADVWKNGNLTITITNSFDKKTKLVKIGDDLIPDVNQENDTKKL